MRNPAGDVDRAVPEVCGPEARAPCRPRHSVAPQAHPNCQSSRSEARSTAGSAPASRRRNAPSAGDRRRRECRRAETTVRVSASRGRPPVRSEATAEPGTGPRRRRARRARPRGGGLLSNAATVAAHRRVDLPADRCRDPHDQVRRPSRTDQVLGLVPPPGLSSDSDTNTTRAPTRAASRRRPGRHRHRRRAARRTSRRVPVNIQARTQRSTKSRRDRGREYARNATPVDLSPMPASFE